MPCECRVGFLALALVVFGMVAAPVRGAAITETLSPNFYMVAGGGQFTISGILSFPDAATYNYENTEYLFGLAPTSPHLGIVAGSLESSTNFPGGLSGAYFEDIFGQGGWLGPVAVTGPAVTAVDDWRTFVVPVGTLPGVYAYSYGVLFSGSTDETLFATNLEVDVVAPEPRPLILVGLGLMALVTRRCSFSPIQRKYATRWAWGQLRKI